MKVAIVLVVLLVFVVGILLVTLLVLLLIKLLGGGSLPGDLQGVQSFVESTLQPLLNILQTFQGLGD